MSTSARQRRSAGLDGVRGLAALTVFIFHIWLYGAKGGPIGLGDEIFNEFRIGLICFFVLSGYLLYGAFAKAANRQVGELPMRRYALRRAARILPAYYVSLIGSIALLEAVAGAPGVRLPTESGVTLFFFFAQNYSDRTIMTLNPVTWTLCLEVAFYVLLPILGAFAYHVAKGRVRPQVALLAGLVVVGLAWNVAGYLAEWHQPATKALPAYLPYFAVGMLLALWVETRKAAGRKLDLRPGVTALVMLLGVALVVGNGYWHATSPGLAHDPLLVALHDVPAGVGFALVIMAVVAGHGPSLAWLQAQPLAKLGLISYGVYLWHVPLILFVKEMTAETPTALELGLLVAPLAVAAGTASWIWVERPLMNAANSRAPRAPARA